MKLNNKDERLPEHFELGANEVNFHRADSPLYGKIKKYQEMANQPLATIMSNFYRIYLNRELISADLFEQQQEVQHEFTALLYESPYYDQSVIIGVVKRVLHLYRMWAASMRHTIFLMEDTIKEVETLIEERYITKDALERAKEAFEYQVEDITKPFNEAVSGKVVGVDKDSNNKLIIQIYGDSKNILKAGDKLRLIKGGNS